MSCKGMLLLAGVVLALGSSAEAGEWSHKEVVSYRENRDPSWIYLDVSMVYHSICRYRAHNWLHLETSS